MAINTNDIKWAESDVNDPITGAPNKVAPTAEFQNDGLKRGEPVPRSYLNYMLDKNHEQHVDLQQQIDELAISAGTALLQQIYHVGAYYMSDDSQSPADRFGFGTWERVKGKFIVGIDENDSDFNSAGKTGGNKTHTHTNNLATASAGAHTHVVDRDGWGSFESDGGLPEPSTNGRLVTGSGDTEIGEKLESLAHADFNKTTTSNGNHTHTITGGIDSASNVPPYIATYMWKRTA